MNRSRAEVFCFRATLSCIVSLATAFSAIAGPDPANCEARLNHHEDLQFEEFKFVDEIVSEVEQERGLASIETQSLLIPKFYQNINQEFSRAQTDAIQIAAQARGNFNNLQGKLKHFELGNGRGGKFRSQIFSYASLFDQAQTEAEKKLVFKKLIEGVAIDTEPDYFAMIRDPSFSVELKKSVYRAMERFFEQGRYSYSAWMGPLDRAMKDAGL